MKKVEVKSLGIKSIFKTTIYMTSVPLAFMFVIGFFVLVIGLAMGQSKVALFGLPYMIMPFFMVFIYGLLGMLTGTIYNIFSKKFGGLELTIEEKNELEHI